MSGTNIVVLNDPELQEELAKHKLRPTFVNTKANWDSRTPYANIIVFNTSHHHLVPGMEDSPSVAVCVSQAHEHVRKVISGEIEPPFRPWQPPSLIHCDSYDKGLLHDMMHGIGRSIAAVFMRNRMKEAQDLTPKECLEKDLTRISPRLESLNRLFNGKLTAEVHWRNIARYVRERMHLKLQRRREARGQKWASFDHDEPYMEQLCEI